MVVSAVDLFLIVLRLAPPYARYDPAEANRLLDEMGLTNRDRDGFRTLSNGDTINLTAVQVGKELSSEGHELVKDYWEDIGIKFTLREVEGSFYWDFTSTDDYVLVSCLRNSLAVSLE